MRLQATCIDLFTHLDTFGRPLGPFSLLDLIEFPCSAFDPAYSIQYNKLDKTRQENIISKMKKERIKFKAKQICKKL